MKLVQGRPKLEAPSIPVIVAHGWSEHEKRAYRVADNQLAARASWTENACAVVASTGRSGLPTPLIGNLQSGGNHLARDIYDIGGAPVMLHELLRRGMSSARASQPDTNSQIAASRPTSKWLQFVTISDIAVPAGALLEPFSWVGFRALLVAADEERWAADSRRELQHIRHLGHAIKKALGAYDVQQPGP